MSGRSPVGGRCPLGFGILDLVLVAAYLGGVTLLGSLAGRRQGTTQDYFLAGRRAPWWLVTLSIVATETSTLTFVAVPGIAFREGGDLTFLQVAVGYLLGRILVAWLLVPAYMEGELQTAYELLQHRVGTAARRGTAAIFIVWSSRTVGIDELGVGACDNRFRAVVVQGGRTYLGEPQEWGSSCTDMPPGPLDEKVFDIYGGEIRRQHDLPR